MLGGKGFERRRVDAATSGRRGAGTHAAICSGLTTARIELEDVLRRVELKTARRKENRSDGDDGWGVTHAGVSLSARSGDHNWARLT